ncbi:hypothetical protein [Gluconacetobacter tumulisoli]|uniref:Uncharacterized protein n=1 Tax=Gluconacetobacter tumulisoli TaxID=1286189 RepID=A0A7W4K587_9PROT|nr:hypothetical protein [Gluconacetobacter tumulisoli]MBB2200638.1 hypothetical protein [Gluconacetobacter tumulisoli]
MPAHITKREGASDAPPRAVVYAPNEPAPPAPANEAERRDPAARTPAQIHAAHRARLRRVHRR